MPDQQDTPDPIMDQISAAIGLSQSGDQAAARQRFAAIWDLIGPDGDPFHRCTLAHYAADVQLTAEELSWDLRALAAAEELTDERVRKHHHSLAVAGFYPSLHLNLARDYQKLGDLPRARAPGSGPVQHERPGRRRLRHHDQIGHQPAGRRTGHDLRDTPAAVQARGGRWRHGAHPGAGGIGSAISLLRR